jgi:3-deoxy-D-manno-octulosonate 8-phosphate phosphatase (KDO 8-P phosphatase)
MNTIKPSLSDIEVFIFDFDGVLTNNLVHLSQDGKEWVSCSRSDGLAFDVLRKLKLPSYILSTEKNLVVAERAKKLKIKAFQGVKDKAVALKAFSKEYGYKLERILYVGNDLNDYEAMKLCGYSVCPSDSHSQIQKIADIVLKTPGGEGIVRELLEDVLEVDIIKILYS